MGSMLRRPVLLAAGLIMVLAGLAVPRVSPAFATSYDTIPINGDCSVWQSDEKINGNDGTQTWITWDASTVYVAWLGGGAAYQKRIIAFDLDPGTSDGSTINYSGVTFPATGQPDYVAEVSNYNTYFTTRTGNGLNTVSNPSGAANYFSSCGGNNFTELALPRSLFTGGSVAGLSPTNSVGVYSYFVDPSGGNGAGYEYGGMPQGQVGDGTPTQTFNAMDYFSSTDSGRSPNTFGQVTAAPSNSIHWDGLFADQSPFFMSPVESTVNGSLTLRFRALHGDLTSVNVNWYDSANPGNGWNGWIPMTLAGQDATGKYDIWQADASALLTTASTKFYRFQANQNSATTWYNADGPTCGSGTQSSCQAPSSENFWVIPGYASPAWSHNALFYQIFPDRFRDGNTANDLPYHSSTAVNPDGNGNCPAGSYNYGGTCAFTHNSWAELPAQPPQGQDFFGGDLAGITQEIDPYLKQTLGVNALYLNPIFASPSNHKYDTQDYFTVDPHFGTNTGSGQDSLTTLINTAHSTADFSGDQRMSIMLDGVFNHTGNWNCWFSTATPQPPYKCGQGTPPGAQESLQSPYIGWYQFPNWPGNYCAWAGYQSLPQLNYSSTDLQNEIYATSGSVMQSYLTQYGIDGWRLDVADNYSRMGASPGGQCSVGTNNHQIWQSIEPDVKGAAANALILGEYWQKPTDWLGGYETNAPNPNGNSAYHPEWDSVMNYNGFNIPISEFFTGQNVHGSVAPYCGSACDGADPTSGDYDSNGYLTPSGLAKWLTGTLADNNRDSQLSMLNSLGTHDTARFLYRACISVQVNGGSNCTNSATTPSAAFAKLKLATELQMTYVGMPSIYYGDETGMTGANDPDNRRPFDWNQADWNMDVFNTTRALIANRNAHPALRSGSFQVLLTDNASDVFAFGRALYDGSNVSAPPTDAAITVLNNDPASAHSETLDATRLSLMDGTVLTDVLTGTQYTVQNGQIAISLPADTGAVLVTGNATTVQSVESAPAANFPSSTPARTTTTVTAPSASALAGDSVTFTATVSSAAGTPVGSVQFGDNGQNLGAPVPLTNGSAQYSTSSLGTGSHTITANFIPSGGAAFYGSSGLLDGGEQITPGPAITGQPQGAAVNALQPFSLSVTATNTTGYQWYHNGIAIPGATGDTYSVPSATASDAGSYYVTVSAGDQSVQSTVVTVTVTLLAQSITFMPATTTFDYAGSPIDVPLGATASSGLTVTYSIVSAGTTNCSLSGTTLRLAAPGSCVVEADQPGDNLAYAAARPATVTFLVNKEGQQITLNPAQTVYTYGAGSIALGATASSGLAVRYSLAPTGACSLNGSALTIVGIGRCAVTASQDGNDVYNPAGSVTVTFTINPAPATITSAPSNLIPVAVSAPNGSAPLQLAATVSAAAGNIATAVPVTYSLTPFTPGSGASYSCTDSVGTGTTGNTLHSACTVPSVAANLYILTVTAGGNYTGSTTGIVTVYDPWAPGIQGDGHLPQNGAAGRLTFSAGYDPHGTLNGDVNDTVGNLHLDHAALAALVVVSGSSPGSRVAYIEGVARVNGKDGYPFLLTAIVPSAQATSGAQAGLQVLDPSGAPYPPLSFPLTALTDGHIQLH